MITNFVYRIVMKNLKQNILQQTYPQMRLPDERS